MKIPFRFGCGILLLCYLISFYLVCIVKMFPLANVAQSLRPTFRDQRYIFRSQPMNSLLPKMAVLYFKKKCKLVSHWIDALYFNMTVFIFSSMFRFLFSAVVWYSLSSKLLSHQMFEIRDLDFKVLLGAHKYVSSDYLNYG